MKKDLSIKIIGGLIIILQSMVIYIFNNLLALAVEKIRPPNNVYLKTALKSCPIGYSLIVEIKK